MSPSISTDLDAQQMYSLAYLAMMMQPDADEATSVRMAQSMLQPMQNDGREAAPPLPSRSIAAPGVYAVYAEDRSLQVSCAKCCDWC